MSFGGGYLIIIIIMMMMIVTVTDIIAALCLSATSACAGSAAEAPAKRKEDKYAEMSSNYLCFLLAFETFGPINQVNSDLFCGSTTLPHSWWSSWNFFSFSTSFCFYSALSFCLFLQLDWKPSSAIFGPAETLLEFYSLLDNFLALGNQVPRAIEIIIIILLSIF